MSVLLWVVLAVLAVLLFAFSVYAFAEGGLGLLSGARYDRCPRCGHHGLVARGRLHAAGCPHPSYRQRFRTLCESWSAYRHLGHGHQ